jgi:H-NS histone family
MQATLISPYLLESGKVHGSKLIRAFIELVRLGTLIYVDEDGKLLNRYGEISKDCENAKIILKLLAMDDDSPLVKVSAEIDDEDWVKSEISILKEVLSHKNLSTDSMDRYNFHKGAIQKNGISIVDVRSFLLIVKQNKKLTNENLNICILSALKEMVQHKASDKIENLHNDILAKILRAHGTHEGFNILDQTRTGVSSGGGVGSLDLCVVDNFNSPFSIVECLVGRSFGVEDTNVIAHFNKLINDYDKIGLSRNYLITYCDTANFSSSFKSYEKIISKANSRKEFCTPYKVKEYGEQETGVTNIRLLVTEHEREQKVVQVFHYFTDMSKIEKVKDISVVKSSKIYVNPANKNQIYSGRGRKPNWLIEYLKIHGDAKLLIETRS